MEYKELIEKAKTVFGEFQLSEENLIAGNVGCALKTNKGNVFTGICLDLACGIGFCAEHAAVAEMLKWRETVVESIVAVGENQILLPCGRCRELLMQVSKENLNTKVIVDEQTFILLSELLPKHRIEEL